jgi:pilus assembly protein Flp/PilA
MLAKGTLNLCKGVVHMIKFVKSFVADESGASAAEYALILAIVGAGIAAAAFALGGAISGAMSNATSCITNGATSGGC